MESNTFEQELKTLEANKSKLLDENPLGGYVVIKGEEILGVWGTRADALRAGIQKYGDHVAFLVRNIQSSTRVINFSRYIKFGKNADS